MEKKHTGEGLHYHWWDINGQQSHILVPQAVWDSWRSASRRGKRWTPYTIWQNAHYNLWWISSISTRQEPHWCAVLWKGQWLMQSSIHSVNLSAIQNSGHANKTTPSKRQSLAKYIGLFADWRVYWVWPTRNQKTDSEQAFESCHRFY